MTVTSPAADSPVAGILPQYLNGFGFLKYDHDGDSYLPKGELLHLPLQYRCVTKILAIDCEMVGVEPLGDSALARVAIVNEHGFCIFDKFVKPDAKIRDYRTDTSGIRKKDLDEKGENMDLIRNEVREILFGRILIGHAIHNDIDALGLSHPKEDIRDTATYFKTVVGAVDGGGFSLKNLVEKHLKIKIQEGEHSPIVDAQATLKLYLKYREIWEASQLRIKDAGSQSDYRALNIYPRKADVHSHPKDVFLRKNKLTFKSNEEYLDIQFRLLNEDFNRPLRQGIKELLTKGKTNPCNPTIRVYHNVKITKHSDKNGEVKGCITVQIPRTKENWKNLIDWEEAKSFLDRQLVILTPNNFESIKCGRIIHPPNCEYIDEQIRKGIVNIGLIPEGPTWLISRERKMEFTMIESVAYFEAYFHTLKSLQSLKLDTFPLRKYLVESDPRSFYVNYKCDNLNFDALFNGPKSHSSKLYDLHVTSQWPNASQFDLNPSQYKAFQNALTSQLSIIQGPPGTGKTHLALQIIKVFLTNPQLLSSPILIVAQTNHALDNVLESVLRFTQEMTKCVYKGRDMLLRVGGGSKSEEIFHVTERAKSGLPQRKKFLMSRIVRCEKALSSADHFSTRKKAFAPNYIAVSSADLSNIKAFLSESIRIEKEHLELRQNSIERKFLKKNPQQDSEEPLKTEKVVLSFILKSFVPLIEEALDESVRKGQMKKKFEEIMEKKDRILKSSLTLEHKNLLKEMIIKILPYLKEKLKEIRDEYYGIKDIEKGNANVKVVGMTCTGAAKNRVRITEDMKCEVMIIEEAAHVLEAHVVGGLTKHIKQLILIGDHKQLRPSVSTYDLAQDYGLDISLMERLVKNGKNHGIKNYSQLTVQHRMRPEISKLITPVIYKFLENHPSVKRHPDILGVTKNVYFINHTFYEERVVNTTSYSNAYEASYLVELCKYLLLQGYPQEKISIITTYIGQRNLLEKVLRENNIGQYIRVCCVDGFQGEENDIILLSLVRSNPRNSIGFLKTDNRVNVALSRARHGLFIIGNMTGLKSQSKTWAEINRTLVKMKSIGPGIRLKCLQHQSEIHVTNLKQFNFVLLGGCAKFCKGILKCGHVCPEYCHNYDRKHKSKYKCKICADHYCLLPDMSRLNI